MVDKSNLSHSITHLRPRPTRATCNECSFARSGPLDLVDITFGDTCHSSWVHSGDRYELSRLLTIFLRQLSWRCPLPLGQFLNRNAARNKDDTRPTTCGHSQSSVGALQLESFSRRGHGRQYGTDGPKWSGRYDAQAAAACGLSSTLVNQPA